MLTENEIAAFEKVTGIEVMPICRRSVASPNVGMCFVNQKSYPFCPIPTESLYTPTDLGYRLNLQTLLNKLSGYSQAIQSVLPSVEFNIVPEKYQYPLNVVDTLGLTIYSSISLDGCLKITPLNSISPFTISAAGLAFEAETAANHFLSSFELSDLDFKEKKLTVSNTITTDIWSTTFEMKGNEISITIKPKPFDFHYIGINFSGELGVKFTAKCLFDPEYAPIEGDGYPENAIAPSTEAMLVGLGLQAVTILLIISTDSLASLIARGTYTAANLLIADSPDIARGFA